MQTNEEPSQEPCLTKFDRHQRPVNNESVALMAPFSTHEDELLIEAVRNYKAIYDHSHKDYKDIITKDNIWQKISRMVGKKLEDCKKRWRTIKDNYFKIKNKQMMGTRSADRPPKWALYNTLNFLDTIERERRPKSNLLTDHIKEEDQIIVNMLPDNAPELNYGIENATTSNETNEHSNSETPPIPSKRNSVLSKMVQELAEKACERMNLLDKMTDEDDVDAFMRSIAISIKKLPPPLIAKAKLKILTAVTEVQFQTSNMDQLG